MDIDYTKLHWRIGRKLGRTIYAQLGNVPSDNDPILGMMDIQALAEAIVTEHNKALESN